MIRYCNLVSYSLSTQKSSGQGEELVVPRQVRSLSTFICLKTCRFDRQDDGKHPREASSYQPLVPPTLVQSDALALPLYRTPAGHETDPAAGGTKASWTDMSQRSHLSTPTRSLDRSTGCKGRTHVRAGCCRCCGRCQAGFAACFETTASSNNRPLLPGTTLRSRRASGLGPGGLSGRAPRSRTT